MALNLAAILLVAAVALFVAAPLAEGFTPRRGTRRPALEALEHDRELAMQGLRELEFDHEMGKVDDRDYQELKRSLEDRALAAMSSIESTARGAEARAMHNAQGGASTARATPAASSITGAAGAAAAPENSVVAIAAIADGVRAAGCPRCGVRAGTGYRFCAACGSALAADGAAARAE
ncbi:MAG: c-type cytochrome biogenesis protein CcmI [Candidatus Binataceae bacterium]|nr:c-type cytochrome biogenesis protein CcmI [Candidatus Binataceae bacterium]